MGNIRSGSQARSMSQVPENYPQTASLVSDYSANVASYEKSVVQQSQEAANARAVRLLRRTPAYPSLPHIRPDSTPLAAAGSVTSSLTPSRALVRELPSHPPAAAELVTFSQARTLTRSILHVSRKKSVCDTHTQRDCS